jgi:hypothetical protein
LFAVPGERVSNIRRDWHHLPAEVRAAVEQRIGIVRSATSATDGRNSAIAARLEAASGSFFVKGLHRDNFQARGQDREVAVNPYLPPSCPRLRWRVQLDGWDLLGYDVLDNARPADYRPGSPDLPAVVQAIIELASVNCPPETPALRRAEQRWAEHADPQLLPRLAGSRLLHTDLAPDNVLIREGRAHLVDWAWPTLGAGWIDPAVWAVRLVTAGHSAASAEHWASQIPAWHGAPPAAREGFAAANASLWAGISDQRPGDEWLAGMKAGAAAFAQRVACR